MIYTNCTKYSELTDSLPPDHPMTGFVDIEMCNKILEPERQARLKETGDDWLIKFAMLSLTNSKLYNLVGGCSPNTGDVFGKEY